MSCGSTPVDESNVFGCPDGFKRRGPGGHLGASNHKSTKSNEEMNDFREDVQNEAWEFEIYVFAVKLCSGSIPVDKIKVLELKIKLWLDSCR